MPQCCDVARFFGTYVGGDDEIEKVHTDCWRQLIDKPSATVGRASSKDWSARATGLGRIVPSCRCV